MSGENRVYDRVKDFSGGMNNYKYAADLPLNQSQLLQNFIILDNGRAVTRPGANQIDSKPSTFTNINPKGTVQGMGFLDNFTNGQFLIVGEGGNLYQWNGAQWSNALAFTLTSANVNVAMEQGADTMLISDGVKPMQYYDGVTFTAASTGAGDTSSGHAPTGATMIEYIAGMYVCAGPAMKQGNGAGGVQTFQPDALVFSNYLPTVPIPGTTPASNWAANTNSFRVGNGDGEPIIGLAVLQATAANFPTYNLAVLKNNSIWVLNIAPASFSAQGGYFANMFAQFAATPQGDQVGNGIGCVGNRAFCTYENDLLFMSPYGVYSLQRMEAAAGQYELLPPLSEPIQPYIDRINPNMAFNIQAIHYKQYAIFFVPLDNSSFNNYALVWNGFLKQWMIWTGWTPEYAVVTRFNNLVNLVFGDSNGNVNQWLDQNQFYGLDSTYFDNGVPIVQMGTTRSLTWGNLEHLKKVRAMVMRFNAGNATVNFAAFLDSGEDDDWQQNIAPTGAVLPVILPFILATDKPTQAYRSLLGLPYCNEFWVTFSATSGWMDCRNLVASAYIKPWRSPTA